MNWKQRLFKPKWQNKSADTRLESVTTEQHPELISSLVEIAGTDEDSRVRCAAIKRLHQLENILNLYSRETDSAVRTILEERIHQLAAASNETRPPLELRLKVAHSTSDRDLIEHLASHAPEPELRHVALARVERQGVLGDCAIEDNDADNRAFAASRITQQKTLKRVIESLRKRDKTLYAALQARLHKELLAQANPAAIKAEALRICIALESQALNANDQNKGEIATLHTAWQHIAENVSPDIADRYQRICDRLSAPVVIKPEPVKVAETIAEPVTKPVEPAPPVTAKAPEPHPELARAATAVMLYQAENSKQPRPAMIKKLRHQLEKTWQQSAPPHADDEACWNEASAALTQLEATLAQLEEQSQQELAKAQALLTRMETELEQGELHNALATRTELQLAAKNHGKDKTWQTVNSRMVGMQARLRELREWHHWSNNKIRKRLIAEMEVLPAADLHPDALLDRIKSLQAEWKALEASEQIPGDKHFAAAPWMWHKFSTAGHTAFDTVKPYLDKRTEIQSRHAQSLATFMAELEQLASAEPMDWNALGKGMTRGRKKLHDLNDIPAKQRQKFARKLKATLDKANAVMQAHYQSVETDKMKLIRTASQLAHMEDRSEAIAKAKSLQSDWKNAGSLWRSKEQELWNQFRGHLDPLFEALSEHQASIKAADEQKLVAQKNLCAELKDILKSEEDLPALHGKVQGLQDRWKEIQHPERKLVQTFQDMVLQYQQKVEKAQASQANRDIDRHWLKFGLLHELAVTGRTAKGALSKKTETKVSKNWPAESSDDELEVSMDETCKSILDGADTSLSDDELEAMKSEARALAIGLEFVAGLPSPDEDREQRMQYQVNRLAASMSGDIKRVPALEEAREAERRWLTMHSIPEFEFTYYGERIKQALQTIMEN